MTRGKPAIPVWFTIVAMVLVIWGAVGVFREAGGQLMDHELPEEVRARIVYSGAGGITESDVHLAKAGGAIIVGFHVRPAGKSSKLAEQEGVQIKLYDIIYEAADAIREEMIGLLDPIIKEKPLGKAEVRQVFNITKIGTIAGCMVLDGSVKRGARCRLVRDGAVKWEGKIASLRRIKDDVKEVGNGFECGIGLENFADIKSGDLVAVVTDTLRKTGLDARRLTLEITETTLLEKSDENLHVLEDLRAHGEAALTGCHHVIEKK